MESFSNMNIIKLIFSTYYGFKIKQFIETTKNKLLLQINLEVFSQINIYKSLGKNQTIIYDNIYKIYSAAVLINGNIITASYKKLKVWDINSLKCIKSIDVGEHHLKSVILHGNNIITLSDEGEVKIFNSFEFNCIKSVLIKGYRRFFKNLHSLQNNNFACSARSNEGDYYIIILDGNFEQIKRLRHQSIWITCLVNIGENKFATPDIKDINIYDIYDDYKCLIINPGHDNRVNTLIYHNESNLLLSSSDDATIRILDVDNNYSCIRSINANERIISMLLLSSEYFASVSEEGVVKIWKLDCCKCVNTIQGDEDNTSLLVLKDSRVVALAYRNLIIYNY
jgi:WD40 repeat protein